MLLKVVVKSDGKVESCPYRGPGWTVEGAERSNVAANNWNCQKLELTRDLGGEEVKCQTGAAQDLSGQWMNPGL